MSEVDLKTLLIGKLKEIENVEDQVQNKQINPDFGLKQIQRLRREYTEIILDFTMDWFNMKNPYTSFV